MTTTYSVRPVTEHEQQQAISALVTAFGNDPVMRWVFPDPHQYLTHFPEFARLFGGRAIDSGTAYCAGDFVAAALWLPPGVQPDEEGLIGLLQQVVAERQREALFAILEAAAEYHPAEPHWYLPLLGVAPTCQGGQGYGSALLARALAQCDAAGFPRTSSRRTNETSRFTSGTGSKCSAPSMRGTPRRFGRCSERRGNTLQPWRKERQ
jgi:GNAT superfamily N-acetyltransferase